ncbi:MAG: DUF362 domain-containing protein [Methanomicrobiales archaeon]|nr:DUF362 domain-containing protein [Methanomicrobiales archaeon]
MALDTTAKVFLCSGEDRKSAVTALLQQFDLSAAKRGRVALKANYNSADPFPASTHLLTLDSLVQEITTYGPANIVFGERSGMGITARVLEDCGVNALARRLGFDVVVLDDLPLGEWMRVEDPDLHWKRGFWIPRFFTDSDLVIQTCCLKTHRFGGHFTLSLKNSVGLVAKRVPDDPRDYMSELHSSPDQRLMIAEINRYYPVHVALLDAVKGFATQGPERGRIIEPNLLLASSDRVALDMVGVALLRSYGTTPEVMQGKISEQEQIARAAELGVGTNNPSRITLESLDEKSSHTAEGLREILKVQG